jgi:hypothetical protein
MTKGNIFSPFLGQELREFLRVFAQLSISFVDFRYGNSVTTARSDSGCSHVAGRVQVVLEPSRSSEHEGAINDLSFISIAVFGIRSIVAEEDDAKLPGCSAIKPIIDSRLGALVAKYGLVGLH